MFIMRHQGFEPQTCLRAQIYACAPMCLPTYMRAYLHTRSYEHTYVANHPYMPTCLSTFIHACSNSYLKHLHVTTCLYTWLQAGIVLVAIKLTIVGLLPRLGFEVHDALIGSPWHWNLQQLHCPLPLGSLGADAHRNAFHRSESVGFASGMRLEYPNCFFSQLSQLDPTVSSVIPSMWDVVERFLWCEAVPWSKAFPSGMVRRNGFPSVRFE